MSRILVVEDEQDLGLLLEYNLRVDGHEPEVVRTGSAAVSRFRISKPDLVLLDLMVPIIIVTARGEESDRIKGLELGAEDYIVKPFSVKELLLRVKNVLRRATEPAGSSAQLSRGDINLDVLRHEVRVGGQPVVLTALEFRLLKTFLERPGRVQTRETLLSDVWGIDADITTRTVDTHIKRLREKLGPAGDIIETIRGVGYKLVA